jgi:hypothetical protein
VTLEREVSFRDGTIAATFRMRFVRRKTPIFEPVDRPGYWCRLRAANLAAATITHTDATAIAAQVGGYPCTPASRTVRSVIIAKASDFADALAVSGVRTSQNGSTR